MAGKVFVLPEGTSDAIRALADEEGKDQVLQNVFCLLHHLAHGNHEHRRALTAALLENMSGHKEVATLLSGKSMSTIGADVKHFGELEGGVYAKSSVFTSKAKQGVKRPRGQDKAASVQEFLKQYQVSKSGATTDEFRSFVSRWDSFNQYKDGGGEAGHTLFQCEWRKAKVKKSKHAEVDFFSCQKCLGGVERLTMLKEQLQQLVQDGATVSRA
jgi:hypothetical protein